MSIRCVIGMKQKDGTVSSIYCHNDGYPAGVGAVLGGWYNTPETVVALIALGGLSSLGTKLVPNPDEVHSFNNPQLNVTVAYRRDRGENSKMEKTYRTVETFRKNGRNDFAADYLYLFDEGKWFVFGIAYDEWIELSVNR